jgi:hypothetical protein
VLSSERGSGTLSLVPVMLMGLMATTTVGAFAATSAQLGHLKSTAHQASLAAADELRLGGNACAAAREVAVLNGMSLASCSASAVETGTVSVKVQSLSGTVARLLSAKSTAGLSDLGCGL